MRSGPNLSIVTGTRNRPDSFLRLLHSIEIATSCNFEVVVSDASDVAFDTRMLPPRIRVIREWPRLGCTKGYNVAFRATRGRWVIWLNDDAEVCPGYDVSALGFMESHPEIGLGALRYDENGSGFHANSYLGMVYANFGCISREFGEEIDWFDEDFPMYGNDNALAFKVLLAGRGIAAVPGAHVLHHAIHDAHRQENNRDEDRWRDVDRLVAKYGSRIGAMQSTYRSFALEDQGRDQTPESLTERYK